jgi:tetratricopeptide (TPR) repeat protein
LAQRPTYDTAGIAAAGTPYTQAGEGDVGRIRKVEGERAEFEKTLPDLSAKGIAALQQRMRDVETAEAARKENLGLDRVIQQLLGRAQGAGGAARADIQFMNAQRAAEDAFSQARLGNQQAQLLLEKAQQERQLGRFDRAIALEKDAANLMEKARDNALKAQQIAQSSEAAKHQGAVQMRRDDIQALERLALQQLKADPEYIAATNKIKELSKAAGLSSSPTIQTAFRAAQQEALTIARRYGLTPQDIGAVGGDTAAPAGNDPLGIRK